MKALQLQRFSPDDATDADLPRLGDINYDDPIGTELTRPTTREAINGADGGAMRSTVETNVEAERALLRVKEKLQGIEDGMQLGIRGQVSFLIQTATNPELLCRMYPGWQAWV